MSDYHEHLAGQLPAIRGIVRRLAGSYGLADDMTQECCVRILEKEGLWKGTEAAGWMGVITRRLTLRLRERAARMRSKQQPLPEESPAPAVESGCSEEQIRWVLSQFASLPERQREVLKMRYFENLSTTAIAARLGVSEPAVSIHHGRALETLKHRARGAGLMGALVGWIAASKWNTAIAGGLAVAIGSAAYFFTPDPDTHLIARGKDLTRTVITPHLDCPMLEGKNVLYCASFQLAWDELRALAGGPLDLDPARPIADRLNAGGPTRSDLPPGSFVAMAGRLREGVIGKINAELKQTFDQGDDPFLAGVQGLPEAVLAYAFLARTLSFAHPLDPFEAPLSFGAAGEPVRSFGIDGFETKVGHSAALAAQIRVYRAPSAAEDDNEVVVTLQPEQAGEEILLARVAPRPTLGATVAAALTLRNSGTGVGIGHGATVQIPLLDFDLQESFTELEGAVVRNPEIAQPIAAAIQTIRFKLDEHGAVLRSRAAMLLQEDDVDGAVFQRAFLILLRRTDSRLPYFALWVDNAELLVGAAPAPGK